SPLSMADRRWVTSLMRRRITDRERGRNEQRTGELAGRKPLGDSMVPALWPAWTARREGRDSLSGSVPDGRANRRGLSHQRVREFAPEIFSESVSQLLRTSAFAWWPLLLAASPVRERELTAEPVLES